VAGGALTACLHNNIKFTDRDMNISFYGISKNGLDARRTWHRICTANKGCCAFLHIFLNKDNVECFTVSPVLIHHFLLLGDSIECRVGSSELYLTKTQQRACLLNKMGETCGLSIYLEKCKQVITIEDL
jgi:hypothetical protein